MQFPKSEWTRKRTSGKDVAQGVHVDPDASSPMPLNHTSSPSLQVVVCNCVADLHEYIDRNQLTEDLDGCIPYNHDEWIEQRVVGDRRHLLSDVTSLYITFVTSRVE